MMEEKRLRICMVVPQQDVCGGIAAVVSRYYGSRLEQDQEIIYVESYCDGSKWKKLFKALQGYRQFRKVLKSQKIDAVHIHSSFGPSFYRKIPFICMAAGRGIPVINHIHGSAFDELYENASARKQKLVRWVYAKCSRTIVLSEYWKDRLSAAVSKDKITVIPNYSILHEELEGSEQAGKRFAGRQVLFLGVLTEGKGIYEMPAVFETVAKAVPDVRFFLGGIGEDTWLRAHCSETVNAKLTLPGWIRGEEKEAALRDSAVFFLPSHMEAMPVSVLEAMGYGLPVVATRIGGIPGVVADGESGTLVPVQDTKAMADALISYLTDETAYEAASKAGFETVRTKFSFDRHIDRLEQVYRDVTDSRNS